MEPFGFGASAKVEDVTASLLCKLVGSIQELVQIVGEMNLTGYVTLNAWQPIHGLAQPGAKLIQIDARLGQEARHSASLLLQKYGHEMDWLYELVVTAQGKGLGVSQGELELACQLVHAHGYALPNYR